MIQKGRRERGRGRGQAERLERRSELESIPGSSEGKAEESEFYSGP